MAKPRKLEDLQWMDVCLTWISLPAQWSSYLRDSAIPRAFKRAQRGWAEAKNSGDAENALSEGFRVYSLAALVRRIDSYGEHLSEKIFFPITNTDAFALLIQLRWDSRLSDTALNINRMLKGCGGAQASRELYPPMIAYCREFLWWEVSAPHLGINRQCSHCGSCCTDLWDAFNFTAAERDMLLWSLSGRWDILERINWKTWHCWVRPGTAGALEECPWLRKGRGRNSFFCTIHDVKPRHCRCWRGCPIGYPGQSVKKALFRRDSNP